MPSPAVPFRLALAGAAGLLLLGGVVAVLTVDDNNAATVGSDRPLPPGDGSSTTVAGGLGDLATSPPAEPSTPGTSTGPGAIPAAPAGTATTKAGRGTTTTTTVRPGPAATPGPLVAPKVGAYGYNARTTADGTPPATSGITVTVEAAGMEGATTLQDITIPTDQLGQRTDIRSRVAWGTAGAIVRRSQASGGDCMWQPAWAQYEGGLSVGKTWSYVTTCSVTAPIQATIERRGTRRVTGTQTVGVAGRQVATWTVAVDETTVITTGLGAIMLRSVGTEQLAPSLGVPVTKTEALSGTGVGPGSTSTLTLATLP